MNSTKKINLLFGGKTTLVTLTAPDDTFLSTSSNTTNFSSETSIQLRNGVRRGIIKFDLSTIPLTAKIKTAKLLITNTTLIPNNATLSLYSILSANSDMVFAEMTWDIKKTGTAWEGDAGGDGGGDGGCSVSGTDFSSTAIGTKALTTDDAQYTRHSIDLDKDAVKGWLTNNYGIVMSISVAGNYSFGSQQNATADYRPTLEIRYK